ncbi:hypothetical protein BD309DRAFT_960648 [Dichomitus squalens]|nr:hypothetical protein BD309DRAFT_960648 [Dichomitus squalens]
MEAHLRASHVALEKQMAIAAISDNVSYALSELVVSTHAGVQDLNGTIAEMKDNLLKNLGGDWTTTTMWLWFQEVMLQVLRVHPASFQHPVFHVAYHVLRICGMFVAFLSSRLMTGSVLLVSAWNLISKTSKPHGINSDQLLLSVLPEAPRVRTRQPVEGQSLQLDGDFLHSDRMPGLSLGSGHGRPTNVMSVRRRPRLSRIPDRLCGTLS